MVQAAVHAQAKVAERRILMSGYQVEMFIGLFGWTYWLTRPTKEAAIEKARWYNQRYGNDFRVVCLESRRVIFVARGSTIDWTREGF